MRVNEVNTMVKSYEGNFVAVLNAVKDRVFENLAFSDSITMKKHLRNMHMDDSNRKEIYTFDPVAFVLEQNKTPVNS